MQPPTDERLEKLEATAAFLERQYDQLNQVVIEQGRALAKLRKQCERLADAMSRLEAERIRGTNPKPPHYQ